MDIRLDGKVAIVTGGSSGIGLGCAEMLAASGARVAIIARNLERLAKAEKQISQKGFCRSYSLDVTNIPAIAPTVKRIREEIGEIDILVCSAGINIPQLPHEVTVENWDALQGVNVKGLFFTNQIVAIQSMIPRKSGSIINMASQMGLVGGWKRANYCASKGAVVMLTKAEAVDWAPYNIRINAVAPTFVQTPLSESMLADPEFRKYIMDNILFHHLATVEDVASMVCFLASDAANMITGTTMPVDGGWTAK
jgi:NAD(P)-dependent dehydrogenase (short-subunit alcohol dehydrogenase family)